MRRSLQLREGEVPSQGEPFKLLEEAGSENENVSDELHSCHVHWSRDPTLSLLCRLNLLKDAVLPPVAEPNSSLCLRWKSSPSSGGSGPPLYLGLSVAPLHICGRGATNDVIMMYHVTEEVSLFLQEKKQTAEIDGGAPWGLEGPRRSLRADQVRVRPSRRFGRRRNADSTFSLTVMHAPAPTPGQPGTWGPEPRRISCTPGRG